MAVPLYVYKQRIKKITLANGSDYEFEYDGMGNITAIKINGKEAYKYAYDEDGRLVSQEYGNGDKLIAEKRGTNTRLDYLYDENGSLYGFVYNKTDKYFYVRDVLQNILGIIDSNGTLVVRYKYNAWGKKVLVQDATQIGIGEINPFRFKGYYYDTETGMYYCQSRYYVPEWGRWLCGDNINYLQRDSLDGLNLFAYCANDPINYIDESGRLSKFWKSFIVVISSIFVVAAAAVITAATGGLAGTVIFGAIAGGAVNAGISAGTQYVTTGTVDFGQVLVDFAIGAAFGAIGGTALGATGMALGNGLLSAGSSIAHDWIEGNGINWGKALLYGACGAAIGYASGGGAQHGLTGPRRAALAERAHIIQKHNAGLYRTEHNFRFGLGSNQGRIDRATAKLSILSINNVLRGNLSTVELNAYLSILFS